MNGKRTKFHLIEEISSLRQRIAPLEGTPIEQTPVELVAVIKEAAPDTAIIMLTEFGEMMIGAGERPAGVDRLLGKPVTPAAFRQAVTAFVAEYVAGIKTGKSNKPERLFSVPVPTRK